MRIKAHHILYSINILTLVLILLITFFPDNVSRIILGLPLVLFFPGHVLISALFYRKSSLESVERIALSFVLSIALVPIIGLILNYTSWGITVYSVLISLSIFIFVISVIAWFRQWKLPDEETISLQIDFTTWNKRNTLSKVISVVLITIIIGTAGVLIYTIATPKTSEKFTEFYILDSDGKAIDYPGEIRLGNKGKVVLGIINQEQVLTGYRVEIKVNEALDGTIEDINLEPGEKLEREAEFTPKVVGDDQKVEFILYKDEQTDPYLNLHLWIDVK